MDYSSSIKAKYPELTNADFEPFTGKINIRDDGDGIQYIAKWEYSKPLPEGFVLGKLL